MRTTNSLVTKDVFVFQNEIAPSDFDDHTSPVTSTPTSTTRLRFWPGSAVDDDISDPSSAQHKTHRLRFWHEKSQSSSSYPITTTHPAPRFKFWSSTVTDLKTIRWRHLFKGIAIHSFPLATIVVLIWAIVRLSVPWPRGKEICSPDGNFEMVVVDNAGEVGKYNPWSQESVFAINIAYGNMDFATAKGVDILWDMGFGRGVQGLLTVVAYKVCTKALSRSMEKTPVTLRTFEAVTLQADTVTAVSKMIRDFAMNRSVRAQLIIFWIVISTGVLLSFQSIASAMTGYSANVAAFIQTDGGERIPASQFEAVQYIIHDGSRLGEGFYDNYPVTIPSLGGPSVNAYSTYSVGMSNPSETMYYMKNLCNRYATALTTKPDEFSLSQETDDPAILATCDFMWHVSEYTSRYGFLGLNKTNSAFNNSGVIKEFPSPALNITAIFAREYTVYRSALPWNVVPYGWYWTDPSTGIRPFANATPYWSYKTYLFDNNEFNRHGTCQQQELTNIRYHWGFSSILLLVFSGLMLIWTIGTYGIYLDAYLHSKLEISGRDIGLKRAVLDVHSKLQQDLDCTASEKIGNSELKRMVKNGQVDYTDLTADSTVTRGEQILIWWRDFNVRKWCREEIWWLLICATMTAFVMASRLSFRFAYYWSPLWSAIPLFGSILVIVIGRKHPSRWVWFVVTFVPILATNIYFVAWQAAVIAGIRHTSNLPSWF